MDRDSLKKIADHTGSSLNPVLSNLYVYRRKDGALRIQAQNGRYTVDAPTDLPPMLANADRLVTVWGSCTEEPRVTATTANLTVTSGRLRARVALLDPSQYPHTTPTPETAHNAATLAPVLRSLLPFVAEDASRVWATSVCVTPTHAYATNNVVLARVPVTTGVTTPVNIPGSSIEAILTYGTIAGIGADDLSVTFYLEGDVWVKCQLVTGSWPTAVVDEMLSKVPEDSWCTIHPELRSMLDVAAKLADARHPRVTFRDGNSICLDDETMVADSLEPLPAEGSVNAKMAALVFDNASEVQWHTPKKDVHAFRSGDLVGVFAGMR